MTKARQNKNVDNFREFNTVVIATVTTVQFRLNLNDLDNICIIAIAGSSPSRLGHVDEPEQLRKMSTLVGLHFCAVII